ncbi:hypothetical protein ACXHXM_34135
MCIPKKPKVTNTTVEQVTPQAAPQPAPVAEAVVSSDDTTVGIKASRGASKLSKKRSQLGGTDGNNAAVGSGASGASGLGIKGVVGK